MKTTESILKEINTIFAGLSSISLFVIAISLLPLSKWAITQNDCITRTFRTDGSNNAGVPSKVWSCNGGGD
tara:strand:+ start:813 stop:1025 length:213 start_codon:yes stop_codon:yes gene_type:complete